MEEDHLHIKAQGDVFQNVYDEAISTVDKFGLQYSYDNKFGFLTVQPDTIGCGMKIEAVIQVSIICS